MERRRIGDTELEVSVLGLGCNNFGMTIDADATRAVVDSALDAGVDFFDTADMYGETRSESFLGEALAGRRDAVVLATKFGGIAYASGGSGWGRRDAIVACAEASLERLRTDTIDLYQMHYPDPNTPVDETLAALDSLVQSGKVRAIGCSNVTPEFLDAAEAAVGTHRFVTVQNEWSLLNREVEAALVPACAERGLGFLPYFPLASGVLTGKYRRGGGFGEGTRLAAMEYFQHFGSDENLARVEKLSQYAEERGHSLLELALGWLASQPVVSSVIAGATKPAQVAANAAASGWRLDEGERAAVDALVAA